MQSFRSIFLGRSPKVKDLKSQNNATIGLKYRRGSKSLVIGKNSTIHSNTIIYDDVK